jgi:hypothetical protein
MFCHDIKESEGRAKCVGDEPLPVLMSQIYSKDPSLV